MRQSFQRDRPTSTPRFQPLRWQGDGVAFTQTDILKLERAIADGRGARTITFFDQSVTFNSIADMLALLAVMRLEVNASTRQGYRLAATRKGV